MATTTKGRPVVEIPDRKELTRMLSAGVFDIDQRVAYVNRLLNPVRDTMRAFDNLERDVARLTTVVEQQAQELRSLRQQLSGLSPGERAAVDARRDMQQKISRARSELPTVRRRIEAELDRLEEILKK